MEIDRLIQVLGEALIAARAGGAERRADRDG